jgi:hypothetical protein
MLSGQLEDLLNCETTDEMVKGKVFPPRADHKRGISHSLKLTMNLLLATSFNH